MLKRESGTSTKANGIVGETHTQERTMVPEPLKGGIIIQPSGVPFERHAPRDTIDQPTHTLDDSNRSPRTAKVFCF